MVCVKDDFFLIGVLKGFRALDVGVVCDGAGGWSEGRRRGYDRGCAGEAGEVASEDFNTVSICYSKVVRGMT